MDVSSISAQIKLVEQLNMPQSCAKFFSVHLPTCFGTIHLHVKMTVSMILHSNTRVMITGLVIPTGKTVHHQYHQPCDCKN